MKNKIIGSLIGLAVGDAMGAPLEFRIPSFEAIQGYVEGGIHHISIGEWTDDTSMALALAQSLINQKGFNPHDIYKNYLDWYDNGEFCTRDKAFDIGNTIARSLALYKRSNNPYSGLEGNSNSGNGSLMRLAPIPLVFHKNIQVAIDYADKSSQMTHKSKIAIDACKLYTQMIIHALHGQNKHTILNISNYDLTDYSVEIIKIMEGSYKEDKLFQPTGYVVDTLEAAMMAFYQYGNFKDGLLAVVNLGYDSDTVGAVYGQLAGAYYGLDHIPHKWKKDLMFYEDIMSIADGLYNLSTDDGLRYDELTYRNKQTFFDKLKLLLRSKR